MELQVFTPGYGKLNGESMIGLMNAGRGANPALGEICKGLANAKYVSYDGTGRQTIDPNRYTIHIERSLNFYDGRDHIFKVVDNYGRTYYKGTSVTRQSAWQANPDYWNIQTNTPFLDKTQPPHFQIIL